MSATFPYVHILCPCSDDLSLSSDLTLDQKSSSRPATRADTSGPDFTGERSLKFTGEDDDDEDEEDKEETPFDPRDPRSAFSLFPIENLLYCEDCHQIRCSRCVQDEIVCYFCPGCLFEVPSSSVKADGNRCTRNCFQCPVCTSILSITSHPSAGVTPLSETPSGPFVLLCNHCRWSTTELEPPIQFDKPTSLFAQLSKLSPRKNDVEFLRLKQHYAQQLGNAQEDFSGSPGALTRLMGLYTGIGQSGSSYTSSGRKVKGVRKLEMREIERPREIIEHEDAKAVERLLKKGYEGTSSIKQRLMQANPSRFLSDSRPSPVLLRTKRSKRCRACRHILVKPESKVSTTRFRIRLVAPNYIPRLSLKRLDQTIQYNSLIPHKTHRFILTVENPLFDQISVSLLTPSHTETGYFRKDHSSSVISNKPTTADPNDDDDNDHGNRIEDQVYKSRVTILCPEFEVGANTDVWDEALMTSQSVSSPTGGRGTGSGGGAGGGGSGGDVYDRGRNYTCVIIEVVPPEVPNDQLSKDFEFRLVEIPVLVRLAYETEVDRDDSVAGVGSGRPLSSRAGTRGGGGAGELGGLGTQKERIEYSYWCTIGVGRIGDPVEGVIESAPGTPAKGWQPLGTPVGTPVRKMVLTS